MEPPNPVFERSRGIGYDKQFVTANIPLLFEHPRFVKALNNVPEVDIAYVQAFQKQNISDQSQHNSRDQLIGMTAATRWMNPICEQCLDKSDPGKLFACELCGLSFYCSESCQTAHSVKHSLRCCRPDGPLDDGPFKIVFGKIE